MKTKRFLLKIRYPLYLFLPVFGGTLSLNAMDRRTPADFSKTNLPAITQSQKSKMPTTSSCQFTGSASCSALIVSAEPTSRLPKVDKISSRSKASSPSTVFSLPPANVFFIWSKTATETPKSTQLETQKQKTMANLFLCFERALEAYGQKIKALQKKLSKTIDHTTNNQDKYIAFVQNTIKLFEILHKTYFVLKPQLKKSDELGNRLEKWFDEQRKAYSRWHLLMSRLESFGHQPIRPLPGISGQTILAFMQSKITTSGSTPSSR